MKDDPNSAVALNSRVAPGGGPHAGHVRPPRALLVVDLWRMSSSEMKNIDIYGLGLSYYLEQWMMMVRLQALFKHSDVLVY